MSSCILRLYKSLVETWRQVALQRLVKPYFIGSRSFVVGNVKSVLHKFIAENFMIISHDFACPELHIEINPYLIASKSY